MSEIIQYRVHGLDCSEDVTILQREVGRRHGVVNLEFDVVQGRMSVEYDPDAITLGQIVSSVNATGMKAVPWEQRATQADLGFWQRHGRLVMTTLSGIFLVSGFATHWGIHGSFVEALAGSEQQPHTFPPMSMFSYVVAVVAGGWFVFPKALQAVRRFRPDMNLLMVIAVVGAMILGELFEAATVAFLFALSLLLEHWSVERARNAIKSLIDLSPTT